MDKYTTIYALGFFDGVHRGHQLLMDRCRQMAEEKGLQSGAITFDTPPESIIWGRPSQLINSCSDREQLLKQVGQIDTVVMLPFDLAMMHLNYRDFFRMMVDKYGAAGFVCGADYRFGYKGQGDGAILSQLCQEENIPCEVLPKLQVDGEDISSTRIRNLLQEGRLAEANALLGHPHILTGQVVAGKQLGRTLGSPTANLVLPENLNCLRRGVYACKATADGQIYLAVTNVGTRPTVDGEGVNVEAWLLDFSGDLYGKTLKLEFHHFIRPEVKFSCIEDLRAEIQKNALQTRNFFDKL